MGRRIIPAQAGNAFHLVHRGPVLADHPRASGERGDISARDRLPGGSSPRKRGTQVNVRRRRRTPRIIPAQAGNAARTGTGLARRADHPRASGERPRSGSDPGGGAGSSPRKRGTHGQERQHRDRGRIIPAQAGNAWGAVRVRGSKPDHPRASGERSWVAPRVRRRRGSSPRKRGTLGERSRCRVRTRIIPAQAGNALNKATCH